MAENKQRIFLSHGRDKEWLKRITTILKQYERSVEIIQFSDRGKSSGNVTSELDRFLEISDAAIVLATPDDVGALAASPQPKPRARQNVWIELGMFWGRLGLDRILLLLHPDVELPRNLAGVIYTEYTDHLALEDAIRRFVTGLIVDRQRGVHEVQYVSVDPETRDRDWREIHDAASRELIITGIANRNIYSVLPKLVSILKQKRRLRLVFVVVDPVFIAQHFEMFERIHGNYTRDDNRRFVLELARVMRDEPEVARRIELLLHEGFPTFSAVVADGPNIGSDMIAQVNLPRARMAHFSYPRTKLRKRVKDGVYDSYWRAVMELKESAIRTVTVDNLLEMMEEVSTAAGWPGD